MKKSDKKNIHNKTGDNIIQFPKPSAPSDGSRKEDVESGERLTFYFTPDWDTSGDDPEDSEN